MRARKKQTAQGPVEGKWDLPAGWEWRRLGEVATTSSGGTPSRKSPEFFKGTIPWVKSGELNDAVVSEVEEHITQQALSSSSAKVFPKGTLCIALYGATVGKLGFLGVDAATNQAVCAIFSQRFYNRFLFYYLLMQRQSLIDLGQGGAQPNISQTILGEFSTPLPPTLQDQERIVERIDSLFAELDKAEEALCHTITLCEQYKQSVLKAAVTGELSKEWRKTNPPKETGEQLLQRILKERRAAWEKAELAKMTAKGQTPANDNWKKKYKEPQAPDTSGLPELPEGWTWASMDMLGAWSGGGTPSKAVASFWEGSIPWISSKDVKRYYIEDAGLHISAQAVDESATNLIPKNSIVMVMRSGVLKHTFPVSIVMIEAAINQDIKSITLSHSIDSEYLMTFLRAYNRNILTSCAKDGTTVQSVEYGLLQKYPVPIPTSLEQKQIATLIPSSMQNIEDVVAICRAQALQTAALRQSILKQAFTGQLI